MGKFILAVSLFTALGYSEKNTHQEYSNCQLVEKALYVLLEKDIIPSNTSFSRELMKEMILFENDDEKQIAGMEIKSIKEFFSQGKGLALTEIQRFEDSFLIKLNDFWSKRIIHVKLNQNLEFISIDEEQKS